MDELSCIKSNILSRLKTSSKPISLEKIIGEVKDIHHKAIAELLDEDRITSAGEAKWELL